MFEWGEAERYRGVPLVRIHLKKDLGATMGAGVDVNLFYAVTRDAITVTLQDWVLRKLIDEALDGKGPVASTAPQATQFSFSLGSDPGKGLWTALAWLSELETREAKSRAANLALALFRGAPELAGVASDIEAQRSLALAYLGAVPLTPDGVPFVLAKDGARDPARGTECEPTWPEVPVPGSPLAKVFQSLAAVQTQVAFDDEGKDGEATMRSLHARAVLDLR